MRPKLRCSCDACVIRRQEEQAERECRILVCCPFHVDGGDPALPCAQDIPASHFDHAEAARRMVACADYAAIETRILDAIARGELPDPRTTSMREEFALFYGGTRTGRFSSQPSIANKPKKDTAT